MADNKVIFEIVTTAKGLKVTQRQTDDLAKSVDRADKSTKNLDKSQSQNYGRQKQGLIQTANGTKNFSKLSQTIGGGSSGLVGAYATLAANVFAASAAFNALARASKFQQLQEGLELLGNQSGRTLSILASNIRDITGSAISMEQAFQGAALGISGGFGGTELEGLAKIAKGAANALGRDMGDAFDRLTRGAIKLEPEILDELGIMVRLDDAVETYATSLNKSAGALSQVERRQAFMNAILVQGEAKFGDIADSIDNSVYDRLAASFADLTKGIFTFVNETLMLEKVMGALADNVLILGGAMVTFGSTIAGSMIPALGNAGGAAQAMAARTRDIADAAEETAAVTADSLKRQLISYKGGGRGIQQFRLAVEAGSDSLKEAQTGLKSVNASMTALKGNAARSGVAMSAANQKLMVEYQAQQAVLIELIALEQGRAASNIAAANAGSAAVAATRTSDAISAFGGGAASFGATMSAITLASADYKDELVEIATNALPEGKKQIGFFQKAQINGTVGAQKFKAQIRLLGASFLGLLKPIGITLIVLGALYAAYQAVYNTKEVKAFRKSQKELEEILEKQVEYAKEFNKARESGLGVAQIQIRQFSIISNSITEANAKLKEQIKLRAEANKSRAGRGVGAISLGLSKEDADTAAERSLTQQKTTVNQSALFNTRGSQLNIAASTISSNDINPFEDLKKLTADDFIDESTFNDFANKKGLLSSIFQIKDSAELQTFMGVLKEDIPERTKILQRQFKLTPALIEEGAEALQNEFARALDNADKVTQNLGKSFQSVSQTLKDAEKNAGNFLRALTPKTGADAISLSMQAIVTESTFAFEQAEKAGVDATLAIGKAFTETGPNIARLVGPKFQNNLKAVKREEQKLRDLRADGATKAELDKQQGVIDEITKELGGQTKEYKAAFNVIMDMQTAEIERKNILEKQKKILGFMKNFQNIQNKTIGIELHLQKRNFQFKKDSMKAGHDIIKQQFENIKTLDAEGKLTEKTLSLIEFQNLELKDQRALTIANGIEITNLNGLRNIGNEEAKLALEEKIALAGEEHQAAIATNNALLKEIETRKKLLDLQAKGAKLAEQVRQFGVTGSTELSAASSSSLDIKAAEKRQAGLEAEKTSRQAIIDAEAGLQKARTAILEQEIKKINTEITLENSKQARLLMEGKITEAQLTDTIKFDRTAMDAATENTQKLATNALNQEFSNISDGIKITIAEGFKAGIETAADGDVLSGMQTAIQAATSAAGDGGTNITSAEFWQLAQVQVEGFKKSLEDLGPEGAAIGALSQGAQTIGNAFSIMGNSASTNAEKIGAAKSVFSAIGDIMSTQSAAQEAAIDKQIAAEKKRDGKSKESMAKIDAMEKKKVAIQRKAFEQKKKVQLANAIIDGFVAIQSGFATQPFIPVGLAMGAFAIAQTAAQIKGIRSQTFGGGGSSPEGAVAKPSSIAVGGKRSNKVDVSKGASSGELGYLRGGMGVGSNANNFTGAAMGRKGYADGGIIVGERGPEIVTPNEVIPNYELGGSKNMNLTFNVSALDGASVQEVLTNNQGAVVGAIRDAANSYGQDFLPDVNVGYGGDG
jgi:hypothetical protein